jgi:hypothetical protein
MRMTQWLFLSLSVVGCTDDSKGSALDTLPKRGERATDPTIVSAVATCTGELMFKGLVVLIDASDPASANLGTCAATSDVTTAQGTFTTSGRCEVDLVRECVVGTDYVVDLTISNKTGGVTTATIKVRP